MADLVQVRALANDLIRTHLPHGWSFDFDRAKRRAGLCDYTRQRITVSRYLASRYVLDEIHQILLHEVAHALAGHGAHHGDEWKRVARSLGYVGGTTHRGEIAHELAPWVGHCPAGHEHVRFRRPSRATSCGKCSRTYSSAYRIAWQRRP